MENEIINCDLPSEINKFSISYDGGRFSFRINAMSYSNFGVGNDFQIELNNDGKLELTIFD